METGTSTSPIKRRLTAILAADAVGYSKQMGIDDEGTLKSLAAQRAIIDRIIVAHQGRIVGTAGDSVLAEFASSVEAVRCAVEIQEALETRNAGVPEAERLVFRIGVNLGDVMVDGADILGDGVNVAARLEGIADPGGICISSSVYDQIAGKLNLGFVDIGEKSLKNIARPIHVYRFDRSGELAAVPRRPARQARALWIGIGAATVLAIAGVGIWRSGLLEQRVAAPPAPAPSIAQAPAPAPAPVATSPPPEAPSEETKLKLRIAEAERAKAEAELARSRADAEAARQRAAAPRPERKDAAPASAGVPSPVPPAAPPGIPTPSPKAAASIAATPASAPAAANAPAAATAPPAAPGPIASTAPSASSPSANSPAAADRGIAMRQCDAWEELAPFSDSIPVRMVDGLIVAERGVPGQPGYTKMSGRPDPNGNLLLAGSFISILPRLKGREYPASFEGPYTDGQYVLKGRMGTRTCTVLVRLNNRP
jgi:class 3 adenylate cyclase